MTWNKRWHPFLLHDLLLPVFFYDPGGRSHPKIDDLPGLSGRCLPQKGELFYLGMNHWIPTNALFWVDDLKPFFPTNISYIWFPTVFFFFFPGMHEHFKRVRNNVVFSDFIVRRSIFKSKLTPHFLMLILWCSLTRNWHQNAFKGRRTLYGRSTSCFWQSESRPGSTLGCQFGTDLVMLRLVK